MTGIPGQIPKSRQKMHAFNALRVSRSIAVKALHSDILSHPAIECINKSTFYAYLSRHHPMVRDMTSQRSQKAYREYQCFLLTEMLDALDIIHLGKHYNRQDEVNSLISVSVKSVLDTHLTA